MADTDLAWEFATSSTFKPLESTEGWLKCPNCNNHPRTWEFDNGNYARCQCAYKYEKGGAKALSIIEAMLERQMPYDKYKLLLREAWNDHVRALPVSTITTETTDG